MAIVDMNHVSSPPNRIPSLDGLRAMAICGVLVSHLCHAGGRIEPLARPLGGYGVTLFFVISGYLITYLLCTEIDRCGKISLKKFFFRRTFRIFPAYYAYLLVTVILSWSHVLNISSGQFAVAGVFAWNYSGLILPPQAGDGWWFLGHFWTLSLEEQFYLFWPLVLAVFGRRRSVFCALLIFLLCPFLRVATYIAFPQARGYTMMMLHTGADSLMAGCLLALLEHNRRWEACFAFCATKTATCSALLLLFAISLPLNSWLRGAWSLPLGRSLDTIAMVVLMISAIRNHERPIGKLLNSRPLCVIGVLSYSLYVWQQLFLGYGAEKWNISPPMSLTLAFLAALASYMLIERPFLRLRDRLSKKSANSKHFDVRRISFLESSENQRCTIS